MQRHIWRRALLAFFVCACTDPSRPPDGTADAAVSLDASVAGDGGVGLDAAVPVDSGIRADAATGLDAGPADATAATDAAATDAAPATDAAEAADAALAVDAASPTDASPADAAGLTDAGQPADAALPGDAAVGVMDASTPVDASQPAVDCMGYPANVVLEGDFAIENSLDIAALQPFQCIHGTLSLTATGLTQMGSFPNLEVITATLYATANYALTTLTGFTALRRLGVGVLLTNNSQLTTVAFPVLETAVVGGVYVNGNPLLGSLSLPQLVFAPHLSVQSSPALTVLDVGALGMAGSVFVNEVGLTTVQFPALMRTFEIVIPNVFPGGATNAAFNFTRNLQLTSVQAPLLTYAAVQLVDNPVLTTLQFPALTAVAAYINGNTQLPDCVAMAVCTQVGVNASSCTGNDDPCLPSPCGAVACTRACGQPGDYTCQ